MAIDFFQVMDCVGKETRTMISNPQRNLIGYEALAIGYTQFLPDYIYLGKISDLNLAPAQIENTNLILLSDVRRFSTLPESNNIIFTEDPEIFAELCQRIKNLFTIEIRINYFTSRLLHLCNNRYCVQNMLSITYQTIGNPLMLVDPSLFLLKHAGMESVQNEELVKFTLSHGYLTEEYLQEVINEEESHSPNSERSLIIWEKDFLHHRIFACRIIKNGRLMAYLKVLEYNKKITSADEKLIMILCNFLSVVIDETTVGDLSSQPLITAFISGLLEQKMIEPESIDSRVKLLKMDNDDSKYIIVIDSDTNVKSPERLYALKRRFSSIFSHNTSVVYKGQLVVIYNAKNPEFFEDFIDSLTDVLEANHCRAYVSVAFKNYHDLYKHYAQTQSCIDIAQKLHLEDVVIKYEDYIMEHMLLRFAKTFDLEDMIHSSVKMLMKMDSQRNSDFVNSLFCYIEYGNDITAAAKAMHIHYNTLRYRINRIIELTNLDFSDRSVIFSLLLSQKILKILDSDPKCCFIESPKEMNSNG